MNLRQLKINLAPGQYVDVSLNTFKFQAPRGKFSMAARKVDFTSMSSKDGLYGGLKYE